VTPSATKSRLSDKTIGLGCWHSFDFDWVLEGHRFLLSLQETDLEQWEEKLAEEQARGLYSFDGGDLSEELEELHECMVGVESERTTEAVQLSWSVMEISDALVNLGVFPIRDIPEHPKLAKDVLTVAGLILEHLQE
jgi:hypothetical protein